MRWRRSRPVVVELTNGLGMFGMPNHSSEVALLPGQVATVEYEFDQRHYEEDEEGVLRKSWRPVKIPLKIRLKP